MTKSVSRIIVAAVALAVVFGAFSLADAQTDYPPTNPSTIIRGSSFEPNQATANNGFLGFSDINPIATAGATAAGGDTTTTGGTGGGLAITGSEANLGLAIGIGLLAVGGTTIVASRKRDDE